MYIECSALGVKMIHMYFYFALFIYFTFCTWLSSGFMIFSWFGVTFETSPSSNKSWICFNIHSEAKYYVLGRLILLTFWHVMSEPCDVLHGWMSIFVMYWLNSCTRFECNSKASKLQVEDKPRTEMQREETGREGGEVERNKTRGMKQEAPEEKGRRRGHRPNNTLVPRTNYHSPSFFLSSKPWSILTVELLECLLQ